MPPFLLAIALDCIYQLMTIRFVYPLELLFTATVLALVPYALLRGPFNRLARLFLPAARPASSASQTTIESFPEETHRAKPNTMSNEAVTDPLPKIPACHGFLIPAKIISGREEVFYKCTKEIEKTLTTQPDAPVLLQFELPSRSDIPCPEGPDF